ncbi:MAG: hypothetical protein SVK08_07435 [Halobacteriota archaeon]|nr:hypothetical protein [Halobacteriota archaeon]
MVVKDKNLKERAVYVYLPSVEQASRWKELAEKHGLSISRFVIEHVENSIQQEEDPEYRPRGDLVNEIRELTEEIKELSSDNRQKRVVIDKLEGELRRYRSEPFLDEDFVGIRKYDSEMIDLLRKRGVVSSDDLLDLLGIDPRDGGVVRAISCQLENLESYGLVSSTSRGWRWIG